MTKNSLFYKLILVLGIFIWSIPGIADEIASSQCQLTVGQKIIDYGKIARSSLHYENLGIGKLSPKIETVRLICKEEIDPKLTIRGTKGLSSGFAFGKKSNLQVSLDSFSVDGKTVPISIIRNNTRKNITQLEPDDIIQSQLPLKGKTLELVFSVIPSIHPNEFIQPDDRPQSDDIHLDFDQNVTDSFSVISAFSSAACNPTVSAGGVIDYNRIDVSHLNVVGSTVLPAKILTFSVQCDGSANVALRANSNRGTASDAGPMNITGASRIVDTATKRAMAANLPFGIKVIDPDVMGLGNTLEGIPIGGYMMLLPTALVTLDGTPATKRFYTTGQPTSVSKWTAESTGGENTHGGSINSGITYLAYATGSSAVAPEAFTNLSGTLIIRAYITDKKNLNIAQPINLDGSSTIELFYY